jgi:uncharacterized protein (TIGR03437 family)
MNPMKLLRRTGAAILFCAVVSQAQIKRVYTIDAFAGNGSAGFAGDGATATAANINGPYGLAVDSSGAVYIADQFNNRIRKVSNGSIGTVAGNGTAGFAGDGKDASSAQINGALGVAVDSAGNIYIADSNNNLIRKVTGSTISTIVGSNTTTSPYGGDGGGASGSFLYHPTSLAFDGLGNYYIADSGNARIRKVDKSSNISTIAGNGVNGYNSDDVAATLSEINNPQAIAVDAVGNVYIADTNNHRIRMVTPAGVISTIAGTGRAAFAGDGGPAIKASLNNPKGIAVDSDGNVYISDTNNFRIRVLTRDGNIQTIAGAGGSGANGDGGPALLARFSFPTGLAVDTAKNLYVADNQNNRVRKLTYVPQTPAIQNGGVISASAYGGFKSIAPGTWIEIYGSHLGASAREWAESDFKGVNAPTSLDGTNVTVGGQAAFIAYVGPGQINAQVASNTPTGSQSVVVTTADGSSGAYPVTVAATQPGLLAPAAFNIGGKQYAAATFFDGTTFVLPVGAIPGYASRPARVGETIIFYGVGFGGVTPNIPAGQIVQSNNSLTSPVQFQIGGAAATATFAGLGSNAVGSYQFNVIVPAIPASNAAAVTFTVGGTAGSQNLYVATQ